MSSLTRRILLISLFYEPCDAGVVRGQEHIPNEIRGYSMFTLRGYLLFQD
jgi:hypothetical protein